MLHLWNRVELAVIGVLAAIGLAISFYEMSVRYLAPQLTPDWASELVVYVVIWAIFLAASSLVHDNRHIRADLIIRLFPPDTQRRVEIFNSLVSALFCGLLAWYAWDIMTLGYILEERSASSLRFPLWVYYLCLPVSAALMCLRYLRRLYLFAFQFDPATMAVVDPDVSHH